MPERHYVRPAAIDKAFNALVAGLTRLGVSLFGSRVLAVPGRKTGMLRTVPVNLLELGGVRYLVAPRGDTEWVRNLRASRQGELRIGSRSEAFVAHEIGDADKVPVLRAYIVKWWFEVKRFFALPGPDASDAEIAGVAAQHPVFRIDVAR